MRLTLPDLPPVALADLPRAHHYGEFYGLKPLPEDDRFLVVHGNCQAEALRLLVQDAPKAPCASVRMPPVHELTAEEVPLLQRLLLRASVVLTQPVTDGYHDLPLGMAQVAAAAPDATVVVWPVIRYAGLLPWQVVFNHPRAGDPPVVPYHDVRTMLRAAGEPEPRTGDAEFRAVSAWSLHELGERERRAGAVPVSDLVREAGPSATNTVNHPGNGVLVAMARRLQGHLGWPVTAADPGFTLLDSVHAPVDPVVLEALGLADAPSDAASREAKGDWVVEGERVPAEHIATAQIAWYHQNPDVLHDVLMRSANQRRLLSREP